MEAALKNCDNFDLNIIRQTVYSFYKENRQPTLKKIWIRLKDDHEALTIASLSTKTPWRVLRGIGFQYKKLSDRKVVFERQDLVRKRIAYLKKIKELRDAGMIPVYQDETWLVSNMKFDKGWIPPEPSDISEYYRGNSISWPKFSMSHGERLIVVHAGSEEGFVPNAGLIFKAHSAFGD